MKTAFLFPGQGSQTPGMGKDIYEKYEEARKIYDKASNVLKIDVAKLCFETEEEELSKTEKAQLAILVTSLSITEVLKKYKIHADFCTGLSLGEYTALIYGGYLSFEEGLKLVQKRGYYMENNVPKEEFKMLAVMGLLSQEIEEVCSKIRKQGKFVIPANYNYSGQTVISGNKEAVEIAEEELKKLGARKLVQLKTSGPFHTSKLEKAKELFQKELERVNFTKGDVPIFRNIDGRKYEKEDSFKETLTKHMVSPVRFDKIICNMQKEEIGTYIEVGPGKSLSSFVKKENKEAHVMNISDLASLENTIKTLENHIN